MFRNSRFVAATIAACLVIGTPMLSARQATQQSKDNRDEVELVQKSMDVLRELTKVPEDGIPKELLARAEGIVVIPSLLKGGFIIGAKHGKGVLSAKNKSSGAWSPPAIVKMTGGSIGWQIGVESVDLVLLVMNRNGIEQLLQDKFTIGGELSVAAGPVGRNAQAGTNAQANAGILAYSRSKGLFAGATLEGAALRADGDDNQALYGRELSLKEIALENAPKTRAPAIVETWRGMLKSLMK
ncbi:MAG TPA: lipid-binding SYLF domain-containing protein [Vicinamibacterales bacterium]|nr:lipid-binding SYLF domain-containing protein [Vicinamibacterales bacterium]